MKQVYNPSKGIFLKSQEFAIDMIRSPVLIIKLVNITVIMERRKLLKTSRKDFA